ncbi:hypothetical protein EK21DRAFT_95870 [Setomelanomma holmii]|uniref:DUF3176 domain containing protein n=1 Tax=Setomelanomma holmii TaxID=210430 RepID=A0A9P4HJV7_9PLEO|nr:hypothetical protein EK21DRAFT_95870 [Setomelanomma holmii]
MSAPESLAGNKTTLDITQRVEKKLAEFNTSQNVFKRWLFELASWLISAICMGAIVGIYIGLRNRPISQTVQLLTLTNILGKVASATLIVPISEAIGQLKWNWFHESKAMWDFEIFNKASRKGRSLAALGAVLIVLLLAIDIFFQQVVALPERWALQDSTATLPRHSGPALRPIVSQFFINNGTQPIQFGNGTRPDIPLTCPTSDCTWPEYETLATGPLNISALPVETVCGYFLNVTSTAPVLMTGYIYTDSEEQPVIGESLIKVPYYDGSINFRHVRSPILDVLIASSTNGTLSVINNKRPVMHECMLAWCVQTIQSSYVWGVYREDVSASYLNTTFGPFPWTSKPVQLDGENGTLTEYSQDISITPHDSGRNQSGMLGSEAFNRIYGMSNLTAADVAISFDNYFPSSSTATTPFEKPMLRYKNFLGGPTLREVAFNPLLAPNNVSSHMRRLAYAMASVVRSDENSTRMLADHAYSKENYVLVQWGWLAFPFTLFTSGDGTTGLWKTLTTPTLIYSMPGEAQSQFTSSSTWSSGKGTPRKTRIKLLPNKGWRVSGQSHLCQSPGLPPESAYREPNSDATFEEKKTVQFAPCSIPIVQ